MMFKRDFQTQYHTANLGYHTSPYHTVLYNSLCEAISSMPDPLPFSHGFRISGILEDPLTGKEYRANSGLSVDEVLQVATSLNEFLFRHSDSAK
jgi:hypothetical protein